MRDIKGLLLVLDEAPMPDLWHDASTRMPDPRAAILPGLQGTKDELGQRRAASSVGSWQRRGMVAAVLAALAIAIGVAVLTAGNPDRTTTVFVVSESMNPTLRAGQQVVVDTEAYASSPPARGDIIAFRTADYPDHVFIKRVIGIPGDVIEQLDGVVLVNGEPLDEPYAIADHEQMGPWTVQPGHVFVMGDDRPHSDDSRHSMGQIPIDAIEGEVLLGQAPRHDALAPPPAPTFQVSP